jgi:hypothetical protein
MYLTRHSARWTVLVLVTAVGLSFDRASADSLQADEATDEPGAASERATRLQDTGMAKDLQLLRKTIVDAKGDRVSAPDAFQAAARVFSRVNLVGMTKKNVLWMLGDPGTLNDYGFKPEPGEDEPLIYRFDQGGSGRCYFVEFENGHVVAASKPRKREPTPRPVDSELAPQQPETGMVKDLRLLRKTIVDPKSGLRYSSPMPSRRRIGSSAE